MVSRRMKTTPAMACLKTMLTIFSFIFLIVGVAFLVAGVLAKVKYIMVDQLSTINFSTAPWVMIAVGCFIIIVGIMGCCATIQGNTCLLRTYGLLLGLIFICELAGAIVAIIFRSQVDTSFEKGMNKAIKDYKTNPDHRKAFDQAQTTLHCCGVYGYKDWSVNASFTSNAVPKSCCISDQVCKNLTTTQDKNVVNLKGQAINETIYTQGCSDVIGNGITGNLAIIIGTMFGVAFFQVLGLALACCLASTINANKYELV